MPLFFRSHADTELVSAELKMKTVVAEAVRPLENLCVPCRRKRKLRLFGTFFGIELDIRSMPAIVFIIIYDCHGNRNRSPKEQSRSAFSQP